MSVKSFAAASALAVACGALWAAPASTQDTSAEAQTKSAHPDTSRRVCRNVVLSGTRLSRRSCRTVTSWDEDAEAARRAHEDGNRDGSSRDAQNTGARPMGAHR